MYYNSSSEVYVIPAAGGTPTRLAANDPVACSGVKSPGITNSWAKWSPQITTVGGKTYYWMIFSSTRDGYTIQKKPSGKASQLYMTGVVVEGEGLHLPGRVPVESTDEHQQQYAGLGCLSDPAGPAAEVRSE